MLIANGWWLEYAGRIVSLLVRNCGGWYIGRFRDLAVRMVGFMADCRCRLTPCSATLIQHVEWRQMSSTRIRNSSQNLFEYHLFRGAEPPLDPGACFFVMRGRIDQFLKGNFWDLQRRRESSVCRSCEEEMTGWENGIYSDKPAIGAKLSVYQSVADWCFFNRSFGKMLISPLHSTLVYRSWRVYQHAFVARHLGWLICQV